MATYVIGLILLVLLFLAGRHVVNNLRTGKHDCCGCDSCGGTASRGEEAGQSGCSCCSGHKQQV
ncbi:FeoB-associated Cys-rich membrane protein [Anaerovibrio sp.]|uniref:FeoB-associated Cys-rich membrane protein n=1 Tax=Anaerovibrio sp. TaxID=1872532 RepID=UPI003F157697